MRVAAFPKALARAKALNIAAYSVCSSTMLVVNKMAVHRLPVPALVGGSQLLFAALAVAVLHATGVLKLPPPRRRLLQPFAIYTTSFAAGIYANIKALELTSVGVVIAARACLPLLVAVLERLFMGRQLPSARSSCALLGVVLSAGYYVLKDSKLVVKYAVGWAWLGLWWFLLAFQMTYGKHITVALDLTEHERVFYTNTLSLPPILFMGVCMGELRLLYTIRFSRTAISYLFLSCTIGLGISYSGWRLKELVTATTFTLVGVINKMATIGFSALAFPGSTSASGCAALVLSILFGLAYSDAPLRTQARQPG